MPTFVLKKYAEQKPEHKQQPAEGSEENTGNQEETAETPGTKKELTVDVTGSISQIVADALNKVLVNKGAIVEESDTPQGTIKAISTEDINNQPLETLRRAKGADALLIVGKGFSTAQEEWFLTNVTDSVGKIFYTVDSFVDFISSELGHDD